MISYLIEAKRRLVWLWRLTSSDLVAETEGAISGLWLFDTLDAPDGYRLKQHMLALARKEGLRLFSLGPRRSFPIMAFLKGLPLTFSRNYPAAFGKAARDRFEAAITKTAAETLIVGASRGTFATFARPLFDRTKIWEVQHGLLDQSYFPVEVGRFFARSSLSSSIILGESPNSKVELISEDLAPVAGSTQRRGASEAKSIICYSKNPGGGCASSELAEFERGVITFARRSRRRLVLSLHPRDSLIKLAVRHRSLTPLAYVPRSKNRLMRPRLILSSYSTAFTTNSDQGDFLLNVRFGPVSAIAAAEYAWLPTADLHSLDVSEDLPAFRRS